MKKSLTPLPTASRWITHVAIHYDGKTYALPEPNRHHDVIRAIGGISGPDVQGFLDNKGNFWNRRNALPIAIEAGQVLDVNSIRGSKLYSEDLW